VRHRAVEENEAIVAQRECAVAHDEAPRHREKQKIRHVAP
jgi:hypothetical protein